MEKEFVNIVVTMTSLLSPMVVFVNALFLYILLRSKKLRSKPPVIFILNLMITHLIQGLLTLPMYAVKKAKIYSAYPYICDVWRFTYMITFYATCVHVFLVALDRFIAVKCALLYKSKLKYSYFLVTSLVAWIYIVVLCLPPFFREPRSSIISNCTYNPQREWTIFMLFTNTVLVYVLVTLCYLYISKRLKNSSKKVNSITKKVNSITKNRSNYNDKITFLSIRITLLYGITWAPSIFYYIIQSLYPEAMTKEYHSSNAEMIITFLIKFITFFDALLAPFLYCYYHRQFRNELRLFLRTICGVKEKGECYVIVRPSFQALSALSKEHRVDYSNTK